MTWGFGDDWIWQFRKVDDRIQIVRRNVRFRAVRRRAPGDGRPYGLYRQHPVQPADHHEGPTGGYVVDLTPVFLSDLPQISNVLRGFTFAPDRSSWAQIKGFKDNVEIEVAATYASGGAARSTPWPTAAALRW